MTTLKEAARVLESTDALQFAENEEMNDYIGHLQNVGGEILQSISMDEIRAASALMEAIVGANLLMSGDIMTAMVLMNSKEFSIAMVHVLKVAIGLAVSEEWR